MSADPNKAHVPGWPDATKWLTLATLAMAVADGHAQVGDELARALDAVCGEKATVFGVLSRDNPCIRLMTEVTLAMPGGVDERVPKLKAAAEAVKAAFYDWEAGLS